ncbi:YhgE/Pip domain-containing protein [Devriesea agamarum]|uniref:YhgE/Pip domain-containing protein n=1 Tax=Devriesea agamarum TaxID=472569 RepID=UPI00071C5FBE|nr:YhgE/Pip domain-containing protein [Devriesea agamarum]
MSSSVGPVHPRATPGPTPPDSKRPHSGSSTSRGTANSGLLAALPREWTKRLTILFVAGLAMVPIIYSGLMIWSFFDPTHNLNHMQAAVVNEDTGASTTRTDGTTEHLNVGETLTHNLTTTRSDSNYTWVSTDRATADRGLANGTYAAVIEVPSNFSSQIASLGAKNPAEAAPGLLTVTTNDTINYVGGNFTKPIATATTDALEKSVLKDYLGNVYIGFTTMHDKISHASDGAEKLHDGTSQLSTGSYNLIVGLNQLQSGAGTLSNGATQAANGSQQLASGLSTLDTQGAGLRDGSHAVNQGATHLAQGSRQLSDGTSALAGGADKVAAGSAQVAAGTRELDAKASDIERGAHNLGITRSSIQRVTDQLNQTIDSTANTLNTLIDALSQAGPQADSASRSAHEVATGVRDAHNRTLNTARDLSARSADSQNLTADSAETSRNAKALADSLDKAKTAANLSTDADSLSSNVTSYTASADQLARDCSASGASVAFCSRLSTLSTDSKNLRSDASGLASTAKTTHETLSAASDTAKGISKTAAHMHDVAPGLTSVLDHSKESVESVTRSLEPLVSTTGEHERQLGTLNDTLLRARATSNGIDRQSLREIVADLQRRAHNAVNVVPSAFQQAQDAINGIHRLNAGAQQVSAGARNLASAAERTHQGASTLADGATSLNRGTAALANGTDRYTEGVHDASGGAQRLHDANNRIATGAAEIQRGADSAHNGATRLHDGAEQADSGAAKLAEGLATAKNDVPSYTTDEKNHLADAAARPVSMDFVRQHDGTTFGNGLTPLFLSLALWLGGMAIFLMMPPFRANALERGMNPIRATLGGLLPAWALGVVQTIIAYAILRWGVGIQIENQWHFVGIALFASIVFVTINHSLCATFGPIGRFIGLCLIALQVAGAGGTYPIATSPGFIQWVHPYLPITHTVDAFRGAIGGGWVDPSGDFIELTYWLVVALIFSLIGARIRWFVGRSARIRRLSAARSRRAARDGSYAPDFSGMGSSRLA